MLGGSLKSRPVERVKRVEDVRIPVAARVSWNDGRDAVHVAPSGIYKDRVIRLIESRIVFGHMKVPAGAVAALGDDDVDSALDVGVIAVNSSGDIAVADSG